MRIRHIILKQYCTALYLQSSIIQMYQKKYYRKECYKTFNSLNDMFISIIVIIKNSQLHINMWDKYTNVHICKRNDKHNHMFQYVHR